MELAAEVDIFNIDKVDCCWDAGVVVVVVGFVGVVILSFVELLVGLVVLLMVGAVVIRVVVFEVGALVEVILQDIWISIRHLTKMNFWFISFRIQIFWKKFFSYLKILILKSVNLHMKISKMNY